MMDETELELCLNIDQYIAASGRDSKRLLLSTQSVSDSIKHDSVPNETHLNTKVRKYGELDSAFGVGYNNITPEPLRFVRPCKKLKTANHSESDSEGHHDRTYLDIDIQDVVPHDQEILSDVYDTDVESHSSTNASTKAIYEETMDLDTDTDAEVHANSSSDDKIITSSHSYITHPSHLFQIYEDPDDSHLQNHPGLMSSFTTYSPPDEDKENILDDDDYNDDHEQREQTPTITQGTGVNSLTWARQAANRVSWAVSSRYQRHDGGADTDEADTDIEDLLMEDGEGVREVEMEDVGVSSHSGAGEASLLLPLAFPLPLSIPSPPRLDQGDGIASGRRCLGTRPVVHFE